MNDKAQKPARYLYVYRVPDKLARPYEARPRVDGKTVFLGYYATEREAVRAVMKKLGCTEKFLLETRRTHQPLQRLIPLDEVIMNANGGARGVRRRLVVTRTKPGAQK